MKIRWMLLTLAVVLGATPMTSWSEPSLFEPTIGVYGGYNQFHPRMWDDIGINISQGNGPMGGIEYAFPVKGKNIFFSVQMDYTKAKFDAPWVDRNGTAVLGDDTTEIGEVDMTLVPVILNFRALFETKYVRPFVGGGFGMVWIDGQDIKPIGQPIVDRKGREILPLDFDLTGHFYMGLEVDLVSNLALYAQGELRFTGSRRILSVLQYPLTMGVRYRF